MNPFEQSIPNNPAEAGGGYDEENAKKEDFAPFDKPLDPESKKEETAIEQKVRLLSGVEANIKELKKELRKFPEEIQERTSQSVQIVKLEALKEQLLSQVSPDNLEEYLKNTKENTD